MTRTVLEDFATEGYSPIRLEFDAVCASIAPAAIALYDHLLTVNQELEQIWARKFSIATLLFALNRYLTLLKIILLFQIVWADTPKACKIGVNWYNALDCAIQFVVAAFNILRIRAIWGRRWRPILVLLPFALATPCLNLFLSARLRVANSIANFPTPLGGCEIEVGVSDAAWTWGTTLCTDPIRRAVLTESTARGAARSCSIATDALIVILTWMKTYKTYKVVTQVHMRLSVTALLLRDGTIYFATLFVINSVVLGVTDNLSRISPLSKLPARSIQVIVVRLIWPSTLTSIMVSRFLLNLRETSSSTGLEDEEDIGVGTRTVRTGFGFGNLGGDLHHSFDDSSDHSHSRGSIEFAHEPRWESGGVGRRRRSTALTNPGIELSELDGSRTRGRVGDNTESYGFDGDKRDNESKDLTHTTIHEIQSA